MIQRGDASTWKHNRSCYVNHGCRCHICCADNAAYLRGRYGRTRQANGFASKPRPRATRCLEDVVSGFTWPELVALELMRQEERR